MDASEDIVVRVAESQDEVNSIHRLRHDAYVRKGYIAPRPSGLMTDDWDGRPETIYFAALRDGKVLGAVRLVLDSARGLPMEREFEKEIGRLRSEGRKVAEASALVTASAECESCRGVWLTLCKALWEKTEACGVDDLCIAVTQDHLRFYLRLFFKAIGRPKRYKSLRGVLAYPLQLPVKEAQTNSGDKDQNLRRHFLKKRGCNVLRNRY
jgi:N-acyl-L-homoserine lactone synthetase